VAELEEIAQRRDYKMRANIVGRKCAKCGGFLWLYRKNGIKLRCKHMDCLNEEEIPRVCSYCGFVDTMDVTECKICEPIIREITELEVNIETTEKGLKKLTRNLKARKISQEMFNMMFSEYQDEILLCQKKLTDVKSKRKRIETHSESLTNLQ